MTFNHQERKRNILRSSAAGVARNALAMTLGFVYRMVFLHILSIQYLGINSLFTGILGVLSLADLGIGNAIVFRLYGPISNEDIGSVGKLMRFFRKAYHATGAAILVLGLCITPFIEVFIRDSGEVPSNVNLHLVFALFVIQSASSYLFSYKIALLEADQRGYISSAMGSGIDCVRYGIQVALLLIAQDYTLVLASGILVTVSLNWCASMWVTKRYKQVFDVRDDVSREERSAIFHDTFAVMLHKVGGAVLNGTDSILLSKFEGLVTAGVYSNYQLIIASANRVVGSLFSGFAASMGNANVELSPSDRYNFYKKALFANFAAIGVFSACMYNLVDDFIVLWLGENVLLDHQTLTWLCIQFYVLGVRQVSDSYINASGLIVKDRMRPLIEASLNVVISVVALRYMGIAGVVVGTVASCGLTAIWREPYLLYRYIFKRSVFEYWRTYAVHVVVTLIAGLLLHLLRISMAGPRIDLFVWLAFGVVGVLIYAVILSLAFFRTDEYRYYAGLLRKITVREHRA